MIKIIDKAKEKFEISTDAHLSSCVLHFHDRPILVSKQWFLFSKKQRRDCWYPNSKLGYRIGVLGSHFVSTKLFLSSEPSFVYDDTKISTTNNTTISTAPNSFFEMEEKNYWIETPIHLNFIPLRSSKNFFFGAGLAPRVLLKSDATLGYTFTNANGQHEAIRGTNSLMDRRNKWNLFLTTRIGYMTVRGRNKFLVSLSFERSLLKIVHPYHHPNASLVYDDPSYTLNTNSLLAAYTF